MVKAVFFDLDGVLTKDEFEVETTARNIAQRLSWDYKETLQIYRDSANVWDVYIAKITEEQSWRAFYDALKSAGNISLSYEEFRAMRKEAFANAPIDSKMVSLVKKVKSKVGIVGIITDNCIERIKAISEKYNFKDIFDIIIVSEEIKTLKRQKKPFYEALSRAKVEAREAVFIDNDFENNLLVASKLGFVTIYFDHRKRDYNRLYEALSKVGVRI